MCKNHENYLIYLSIHITYCISLVKLGIKKNILFTNILLHVKRDSQLYKNTLHIMKHSNLINIKYILILTDILILI